MPYPRLTPGRRCPPALAVVRLVLMSSAGALAAGCSRSPTPLASAPAEPSSILVEPATLTLAAGHSAWLAAQANDTAGQPIGGAIFRFTTPDSRVLQVSDNGLVTALGPASTQAAVIVASGRHEERVPVVVLPGAPQRLEKVSGDDQQVRAGEAPAAPLTARLVDRWNNPIPDLHLTVESAAHLFPPSELVSGADGIVRFAVPTLTHAGTVVTLLRSLARPDLSVSFALQVRPGPPAVIDEISAPVSDRFPSAGPASVEVRVTDAYGNPVPDVELTARTSKADPAPLLARTDAAGKATWVIAHGARVRRIHLEVGASGSPALHRAFTLIFDAPAPPRTAHRARSAAPSFQADR